MIWAFAVSFVPDIPTDNQALTQLWREFVLIAVLAVLTALFIAAFEKKHKLSINILPKGAYMLPVCFLTGAALVCVPVIVLLRLEFLKFFGRNYVDTMFAWLFALLLNVAAQELFVRGYIYRVFRRDFNPLAAMFVSAALFTLLHAGVFSTGFIAPLSIIMMSVALTLIMELTDSLLAAVAADFAWNFVGGALGGLVMLPPYYPSLFNCEFIRDGIFAGNGAYIEGSVITLAANMIAVIVLLVLLKRKWTK